MHKCETSLNDEKRVLEELECIECRNVKSAVDHFPYRKQSDVPKPFFIP